MHWLLYLLLLVSPSKGAPACDAEPQVLPIKNVQVIADIEDSYMRGISAEIGTPSQQIVLLPWPELNNTWIYDEQPYCDSSIIWNNVICEVRRGNLYNESASKSWVKDQDIIAAGGAHTESDFQGAELGISKLLSTSLGGTDVFSVNGSNALRGFPVGVPRLRWDSGYTMLHALGFGRNSTYLNSLRAAGDISSRVWSFFWGQDYGMDGSIVLGGYDEEKVIGANYTAPLDYSDYSGSGGCWTGMRVIVSDIRVNFRDGSDESIFPSSTALPVCLVPQRQLLLEAPESYVTTFEQVTGFNDTGSSYGLHWSARLFDADNVFDGDITFQLESGLTIRVPNDQYIVPFVDIARNGSRTFDNNTKELLINGVGSQPSTLGRYFFTSAYLMVNLDAGTFTLWQANPTSSTKLVRVFDEETASQCQDASGITQPSASALTTTSATSNPKPSPNSSSGLSGGAIGGTVVGVVAGVAALGFAVFYLIRRRRKPVDQAASINHAADTKPPEYQYQWTPSPPSEVQGSLPLTAEMQGQNHYIYEMDANIYSPVNQTQR